MSDSSPTLGSILAQAGAPIVTGILSFTGAYFLARYKVTKDKAAEVTTRFEKIEMQLALLSQSIQPISVAFQSILVKQLTHYHTPDIDALLQKLGPPFMLDRKEEAELVQALKERTKDMGEGIDESERVAAAMLPFVMTRVKIELKELDEKKHSLLIVAVPTELPK